MEMINLAPKKMVLMILSILLIQLYHSWSSSDRFHDFSEIELSCGSSFYPVCTYNGKTFLNQCIARYCEKNGASEFTEFTLGSCDEKLLCKFVNDTNISSSRFIEGWACTSDHEPIGDFCAWQGIVCRSEPHAISFSKNETLVQHGCESAMINSKIISLALSGLSISGKLEKSLTKLHGLQSLDLSRNLLVGSASLLAFDLVYEFMKADKAHIFLTPKLQYLNLSDNLFDKPFPYELDNYFWKHV